MAVHINQQNFRKEVEESVLLTIIQFKSEYNGPCQIIAPVFEELEKLYDGVARFYLNEVNSAESLEGKFGIHEIPTILFFKNGKIIDHLIGLTSKNTLKLKIDNALLSFRQG